jgi:hypothetical protein
VDAAVPDREPFAFHLQRNIGQCVTVRLPAPVVRMAEAVGFVFAFAPAYGAPSLVPGQDGDVSTHVAMREQPVSVARA